MTRQLKWPGISIGDTDRELTGRIRQHTGVLSNMPQKELLMLSAILAVNRGLHPLGDATNTEKLANQIVHPSNLNASDYEDYRQYIAFIYYLTAGDKDLQTLNNTNVMVKNFVDYAQRGLRYLDVNYIGSKNGSDDLLDELIELLKKPA